MSENGIFSKIKEFWDKMNGKKKKSDEGYGEIGDNHEKMMDIETSTALAREAGMPIPPTKEEKEELEELEKIKQKELLKKKKEEKENDGWEK